MEAGLRQAETPLTCLDVGCGSGRDTVWLARRGWQVAALDSWTTAVERTTHLAAKWGVAERVTAVVGKVCTSGQIALTGAPAPKKRQHPTASTATLDDKYGLVMAIRFLEKGALMSMGDLVDPQGGYFLHCTFQLEKDGSWPYPSPKRADKVLKRGELARLFTRERGWEVCSDDEVRLPDNRPLNCFLARRIPVAAASPQPDGPP
eukprot:TRINITY_DN21083_c0_g1_i1.p1 TRINITY_DN21083_c0_g1~~TRINITY_DN21083_c0_g1_i1.p1  ORF type:complete len:205 (-),score=13.38 TRINITY_DN21083_c0_g1_i1:14-628(-)